MSAESPSLWEKIKTGAKGFFEYAVGSIPRTLLYTAIAFAGSAALGSLTGWDPLGATNAYKGGELVSRFLLSAALGSAISGGVGAWQCVSCAGEQPQAATAGAKGPSVQPHVPVQQVSYAPPHVPQAGLPLGNLAGKTSTNVTL